MTFVGCHDIATETTIGHRGPMLNTSIIGHTGVERRRPLIRQGVSGHALRSTKSSIRKTNDGPLLCYVEVVIYLAIPCMVHSGICKRGNRATPKHHRETKSKAMSKDRLIHHFIIQGRSAVPGTALLLLQEAAT